MSMLARLMPRGESRSGVVVEPMRRKDIAKLMPIERASYPRPWTEGVFQSELDQARRDQRHYVVARDRRDVVGYGGLMFALDEAHVTNIAVHPERRRERVATRLLAELAHEAIRRECSAMTLEVRVSNESAQALYREFGFVPAGVRQRYYENTEDAMVMWCHDIALPEYMLRLRDLSPEAGR